MWVAGGKAKHYNRIYSKTTKICYSVDKGGVEVMEKKCNFCGNSQYETKKIDYLYSYRGNYLLVPDTPVETCSLCGMVYFDAAVLKRIEQRFFAIQKKQAQPDGYLQMPRIAYGSTLTTDLVENV